jgi:hypothetical protein
MLASVRSASARHDDLLSRASAAADLLRPSAEEASPRVRTSDALCRTTAPERGLRSSPRAWHPCVAPCDASRGDDRRARPDWDAVGLGRRPRSGQSAFYRIDPDLAARAGMAVFAFTRAQACPAPFRLPRSGPAPSRVGWSLQTTSRRTWTGLATRTRDSNEEDAPHRLLQPTHDTSTLRKDRLSSAPPSSLAALRSVLTRPWPEPPAVSRVELRLTANLQLRRCPDLPCFPTTAEARGCWKRGIARSWRVPRSTAPPSDASRPRCFRPRAELVT